MSRRWPSRTSLMFMFMSTLVGLLTWGASRLLGDVDAGAAMSSDRLAMECGPFPTEHTPGSGSEFIFVAHAQQPARLAVNLVKRDGVIVRLHEFRLDAGYTPTFAMWPRDVERSIQVLATAPVQVEATVLVLDCCGGPTARYELSCTRIVYPARDGLSPPVTPPS
jgi:hypothetical protein